MTAVAIEEHVPPTLDHGLRNWQNFNPFVLVSRGAWVEILALLTLGIMLAATVIIVIRKQPRGDLIVFGMARCQFLIAMLAATYCVIYSFLTVGTKMAIGQFWIKVWTRNRILTEITCTEHCAIITLCLVASMVRYKSRPVLTSWDVLGLSAAGLSVLLILTWRDLLSLI